MKGMKNILMIGAHYDDVELGCGGTAAKLAEEGKNVYKLTLTDNATDFKQMNIHVDADASIHESASSCQFSESGRSPNSSPSPATTCSTARN